MTVTLSFFALCPLLYAALCALPYALCTTHCLFTQTQSLRQQLYIHILPDQLNSSAHFPWCIAIDLYFNLTDLQYGAVGIKFGTHHRDLVLDDVINGSAFRCALACKYDAGQR